MRRRNKWLPGCCPQLHPSWWLFVSCRHDFGSGPAKHFAFGLRDLAFGKMSFRTRVHVRDGSVPHRRSPLGLRGGRPRGSRRFPSGMKSGVCWPLMLGTYGQLILGGRTNGNNPLDSGGDLGDRGDRGHRAGSNVVGDRANRCWSVSRTGRR